MTMYTATLELDTDIFDAVNEQVRQSPKLMQTTFRRATQPIQRDLLAELQTVPANLPTLPFVWSNDPAKQARARRWYFANKVLKGSGGGRYQRTGNSVKAWRVLVDTSDTAGVFTVSNDQDRFTTYVVGDRQVPSHEATGWYQADDTVIKYTERLQDATINAWFSVVG